jgi:hypothetical protein
LLQDLRQKGMLAAAADGILGTLRLVAASPSVIPIDLIVASPSVIPLDLIVAVIAIVETLATAPVIAIVETLAKASRSRFLKRGRLLSSESLNGWRKCRILIESRIP